MIFFDIIRKKYFYFTKIYTKDADYTYWFPQISFHDDARSGSSQTFVYLIFFLSSK